MTDEELEKVARAATPGPWEYDGHRIQGVEAVPVDWADEPQKPSVIWDPFRFDRPDEDRLYIAAFNPATALALLERVRKAEDAHDSGQRTLALVMTSRDEAELELQEQKGRIDALVGELANLRRQLPTGEELGVEDEER